MLEREIDSDEREKDRGWWWKEKDSENREDNGRKRKTDKRGVKRKTDEIER